MYTLIEEEIKPGLNCSSLIISNDESEALE